MWLRAAHGNALWSRFLGPSAVWTRLQTRMLRRPPTDGFMKLRAGGKRARAMIGDGLSGGGGGVSPSKAMQTYKKKAGWQ